MFEVSQRLQFKEIGHVTQPTPLLLQVFPDWQHPIEPLGRKEYPDAQVKQSPEPLQVSQLDATGHADNATDMMENIIIKDLTSS